jgi:hypothetical protein
VEQAAINNSEAMLPETRVHQDASKCKLFVKSSKGADKLLNSKQSDPSERSAAIPLFLFDTFVHTTPLCHNLLIHYFGFVMYQ